MKFRILHQFFYPDKAATSQILADLAFHLAEQGHQVDVIASRGGIEGGDRLPKREIVQGVLIRRIWSPSLGKKSLLARMADLTSYAIGCTFRALISRRVDRVMVLANPPEYAIVGALRGRQRERYVYVVMDLYPDVAVQAGVIKPGSLLTRVGRWLTKVALKRADKVVVLGTCMARAVRNYGVDPGKIEIIRNWGDEGVTPLAADENPVRKQFGLTDEFVVMYSGNMGVGHRFDDILQVVMELRERADIRFLFVGGGVRRKEVEHFRDEHKLDNLIVGDYFPREQLPLSLPAGDAHFVSLREGFEGLIVPSKTYGIMAAGRPVIYQGNAQGEIARMLQHEGGGEVVAEGDTQALKRIILQWADNRQAARQMGIEARQVFERSYTKAMGLERYTQVLGGGESRRGPAATRKPQGGGEPDRTQARPSRTSKTYAVRGVKYLVTGASGFLGRHFLAEMARRGLPTRAMVAPTTHDQKLPGNPEIVRADLLNPASLDKAVAGITHIVHLAAILNPAAPERLFIQINAEGTRSLMAAAARAGVGHFLLMSSVKAIGEEQSGNFDTDSPPNPTTPHGRSKLAAEQAMFELAAEHGVHCVALRLPMVYGPGVKGNILRLLEAADAGKKLPFGRVANRRSMVYVDTVVDAALRAVDTDASDGKVYLVCDARPYATARLYAAICRAMGKKPLLLYVPVWLLWAGARIGDAAGAILRRTMPINSYVFMRIAGDLRFDGSRIQRDLGWSPKVTLDEGIAKTVQWYRQGCPPTPPA